MSARIKSLSCSIRQANDAAAKTGIVWLSNVVALEGSAYGIQSNVILPTSGDTRLAREMSSGFMEIPAIAATDGWVSPAGSDASSVEQIAANFAIVSGMSSFSEPMCV